jgi:purine-binding chemotaxis protein CheW
MTRTGINWEHARARMRASERALEDALAESPERVESAYRRRALRLAALPVERGPVTAGLPALVFRLGTERYAVELKDVAEVLPFTRCTSVPGAPAEFLGVINLRGELRAVLDLGRVLVSAESGNLDSGFVLVLRRPSQGIGLKVDVIDELREIQREELMPAQGGCFKGLVGGTLILLDVEKVLEKALPKEELLTI